MAPEQAKGQRVDKRADVWAFGCVLYEMLTGTRAFAGDDVSDTLASVLKTEPSWQKLPADVPMPLRTLVEQCLEKDRRKRLGDISGALFVLNNLSTLSGASLTSARGAEPTSSSRRLMPTLAAAAAVLAVVALVAAFLMGAFERTPEPAATTRLTLLLPPDRGLTFGGIPSTSVSLSPDGSQVVYVSLNPAERGERSSQLRVRSLESLEVRDLPGTFGARQPFFSPDGRWVAFFTSGGELKKTALATGNPVNIATGIAGSHWGHAVWLPNNMIVYGMPGTRGLMRLPGDGATPEQFLSLTPPEDFIFPTSFIPEASSLLVWVGFGISQVGNIEAVNTDTGQRTKILQSVGPGWATASGHLVFTRDETMFVAPFDRRRLALTGEAVPLGDNPRRNGAMLQIAFSTTGTLAYIPVEGGSSNVIGKTRGSEFATLGIQPGAVSRPRVSPDGQRVAYSVTKGSQWSLHVRDLARSSTTEILQDDAVMSAAWHPGGQSLAVVAFRAPRRGVYLRELNGGERPLLELDGPFVLLRLGSFSPDGATLAYVRQIGPQHEIWKLSVSDGRTEKLIQTTLSVHSPAFSPDGRLIAYVRGPSTSQSDVSVIDLQTHAAAVVARGTGPVWDRKGGTLYFMGESADDPAIMSVSVATAGGTVRLGTPALALGRLARTETGASVQYAGSNNGGPGYDVFPDGQFVVVRTPDPRDAREIVIVQNWFEELGRLAPTK
jgi:serine/threonine-protein kinase